MTRLIILALVAVGCWTLAALFAWAVVHVGARCDPPEWDEPDDVQPADLRTLWLSDNLTGVDGGPVRWSGWRDGDALN